MIIIGTVEPIEGPEKFERIEVEADVYAVGHAQLRAQVTEGWRLINTRVRD